MPILIRCEHCRQKLNAPDAALGRKIRCPKCSGVTRVQEPPATPAPDAVETPTVAEARATQAPKLPVLAEVDEPFGGPEEEKISTRKAPAPKRRPAEDDEEWEDDDRREVRPKRQLVLRLFVLFLGLMGAAATGAVGALWWSAATQLQEQPNLTKLMQAGAGTDPTMRQALARIEDQTKAYPLLFAGAGLGLVGGILGFFRLGLIGGLLMLAAVVGPAIYVPNTLIFTGFLVLGGLLSFAIRSRKRALAAAEKAAASGKEPSTAGAVLGIIGACLGGLIVLGYAAVVTIGLMTAAAAQEGTFRMLKQRSSLGPRGVTIGFEIRGGRCEDLTPQPPLPRGEGEPEASGRA